MPENHPYLRLVGAGLLAAVLASGCATTATPLAPDAIEEATPEPEAPEYIPVVRYGRYTLVELAPTAAQQDLLLQTIDVSMPEDARATVGDGLRHVLKRSGRSEEHTSELQSLMRISYAVFCLKNKNEHDKYTNKT